MKGSSLTAGVRLKLFHLRITEEKGIAGVGVKSVEIGKKAGGEGAFLGYY